MQRPTVYRPLEGRLQLRMPYGANRRWLHEVLGSVRPRWTTDHWAIARSHLRPLVNELVLKFGEVEVILEFSTIRKCDSRCRDAGGDNCVCSCLGENHGGAAYWQHWIEVGPTTLVGADRQQVRFVATTVV